MTIQEKQVQLQFLLHLILRQKSPEHYLLHILVHHFHQFMVREGTTPQIRVSLFYVIQCTLIITYGQGLRFITVLINFILDHTVASFHKFPVPNQRFKSNDTLENSSSRKNSSNELFPLNNTDGGKMNAQRRTSFSYMNDK